MRLFFQNRCFGTEKYVEDLCPNIGIEILSNTWHIVIVRQESAILLEVRKGPSIVEVAKEFASWAPQDRSTKVDSF